MACKRFCPTIDVRQRLTLFEYPADNWPNIHIHTSALRIIRSNNLSRRHEWFGTGKSKLARLWYCLMTHYGTGNSRSLQLRGIKPPKSPLRGYATDGEAFPQSSQAEVYLTSLQKSWASGCIWGDLLFKEITIDGQLGFHPPKNL